jgi:hypothetical protein
MARHESLERQSSCTSADIQPIGQVEPRITEIPALPRVEAAAMTWLAQCFSRETYQAMTIEQLLLAAGPCSACGSRRIWLDGMDKRHAVLTDECIRTQREVKFHRAECADCGKQQDLIPGYLYPHRQYDTATPYYRTDAGLSLLPEAVEAIEA